jgi:hypothetical protein
MDQTMINLLLISSEQRINYKFILSEDCVTDVNGIYLHIYIAYFIYNYYGSIDLQFTTRSLHKLI